ncbi:MAG: MFS transporter [Desulfobacteraceae bacterium]|nr:MFS transporter [Desulfobacteraceae bacterium]
MKGDAGSGIFYGYLVVAAAFFIMVVVWAAFYSFGVFFKPLLNEFGWTRAMTSGAFSLSAIIMGVLGIAMGGLNDKLGPRAVMSICGLLVGGGYILMSRLSDIWQLYLFYGIILGAGMGGGFVPLMTTVARWFVKRRGAMTGIIAAGIGIGAMVGPPLANRLILAYGWRLSYLVIGATVLIIMVLSAQILRRGPSRENTSANGEDKNCRDPLHQGSGGLSSAAALRTRRFWTFFGMIICFGFCVFSIMVHLAAHTMELNISSASAANILATVGGLSIIGKLLLGRRVDIIGSRKVFIIGFILMSAALIWLVPAGKGWMFFVFAIFFGFAYGGCVSAESPLVAELFGLDSHGLILGFVSFGFTIGGALGPWLTGHIFDITHSYRLAFILCAILSALGLILTLALGHRRIRAPRNDP